MEPSAVSTTSSATISFKSDEDDLTLDLDAPRVFEKNDIHELLLQYMRQGDKWQRDLERVHGFTEAESCECFSLAGKYLHCDEFPEDAVNEKLFPHAKEGWILLKEADLLARKHPKELMDLESKSMSRSPQGCPSLGQPCGDRWQVFWRILRLNTDGDGWEKRVSIYLDI
jgi:hypothetical protein